MRLHRFYISQTIGSQKELTIDSVELTNQVRRVFRLKSGDSVILFDGSGMDYECMITDFGKETIMFNVAGSTPSRFIPSKNIHLCVAVVKKDTFEWIVQKATELGVTKIIPIMAERSEKKSLNMERLNKIAIEASEQSGRASVPFIHNILTFTDALEWTVSHKYKTIAFHTDGQAFSISDVANTEQNEVIELFIGPEGGWSPKELEMFHSHKIPVVSLGSQVLRAETAVIATLSLVLMGK